MNSDVQMPFAAPSSAGSDVRGLTAAEVAERVDRGQVNAVPTRTSRTVREIVRANVLTRFNAILGVLLVVVVMVGPPQDALFAGVLVSNTAIGVVQEIRAKRMLDRLALLSSPRAVVLRATGRHEVLRHEVVIDDLLLVTAGDEIVVDGLVVQDDGLEIDESLLTGESDPVAKPEGTEVLSGSFVVAGSGAYRATRIGPEAYAARLGEEARRFTLVHSELRLGIDRILRIVTWLLIPTAVLVVTTQLVQDHGLSDALRASVAGVGGMIPEGLVLLTSIAFAVGVVRLGRRGVLVQELPALEGLARVDVLCIDKTGTLTDGELVLDTVEYLSDATTAINEALAEVAWTDPHPNATLRALRVAFPSALGRVGHHTPFSSARKWSGVSTLDSETWLLGAPEILLAPDTHADVDARVTAFAELGRRVLLLARTDARLDGSVLPIGLSPCALVVLQERIRPDAAETLSYFAIQGVRVKVLSGDHPATVRAVATRVGMADGAPPVDARTLPSDLESLSAVLEREDVFGRVTPHQKRAMVRALQSQGHVVAMTGDGVNDALALKDADIGVAMGSGAPATRGVAQLVLLDSAFASLPPVVGEGRRVIANVERVANLFLTKTVYAFLLALATGVAGVPFPFFPRHLTIISTTTIGVPAFFLALAPAEARSRPGFVGRVLRFSLPAGAVAAAATFGAYALVRVEPGVTVAEARTVATLVLAGMGLWILSILARPLTPARRALLFAMSAVLAGIFVTPATREFFTLEFPSPTETLAAIGIVALGGAALDSGWRLSRWAGRRTRRRETLDGDEPIEAPNLSASAGEPMVAEGGGPWPLFGGGPVAHDDREQHEEMR